MFYKKNRAKCLECGDVIESESVTEWSECSCGSLKIRGGNVFLERDCSKNRMKELSIVEFPRELGFKEDVTTNFPPGSIGTKSNK